MRNVGCDPGMQRRSTAIQSSRIRKAKKIAKRAKRFTKAGVHISKVALLVSSGLVASAKYGAEIIGMADYAPQRLRSAAHTALIGKPVGRSATCDLQTAIPNRIGGADPAVDVCVMPIVNWLRAL